MVRELGEEERKEFIQQLREGDEKVVCSSFERIINKERAEGEARGEARGEAKGEARGEAKGEARGTAKCVIELLKDVGEPSGVLREIIMSQTDMEVLMGWHKAASRAKSIEDFEQAIGLART